MPLELANVSHCVYCPRQVEKPQADLRAAPKRRGAPGDVDVTQILSAALQQEITQLQAVINTRNTQNPSDKRWLKEEDLLLYRVREDVYQAHGFAMSHNQILRVSFFFSFSSYSCSNPPPGLFWVVAVIFAIFSLNIEFFVLT